MIVWGSDAAECRRSAVLVLLVNGLLAAGICGVLIGSALVRLGLF